MQHVWPTSPKEAVQIQRQLMRQVRLQPLSQSVKLVAGADISFNKYSPVVFAGFVVLDFETLQLVEQATAIMEVQFPYIPGLLSFREIPPLLEAYKKLQCQPDVFVLDGHGIAHPRRLGIAAHFGLLVNRPTVGCAKSLLTGRFQEPEPWRGATADLLDKEEKIGEIVRTKSKVKPVFVSPGHLMDFESATGIILSTGKEYRLPEPTRLAHILVNQLRTS